jgi:hypothetical protein
MGLRWRESEVAEEFLNVFPDKQQIQVYRQPGLGGLEQLESLGRSLYRSVGQEMAACAPS